MTSAIHVISDQSAAGWKAVAQALQLDIITGRLQPRERLVEDDLIERFGVSRYAARRALDEMQSLGLVVRSERRGARIRGYTLKEVTELFELRELLETQAALRILLPVDPRLISQLKQLQKEHDRAARCGDYFTLYSINNDFHAALYSGTGNATLQDAIAAYALRVQPIRMRFVHDEERKAQVSEEHWQMIAALESADLKGLAKLCGRHLSATRQMYEAKEGNLQRIKPTSER